MHDPSVGQLGPGESRDRPRHGTGVLLGQQLVEPVGSLFEIEGLAQQRLDITLQVQRLEAREVRDADAAPGAEAAQQVEDLGELGDLGRPDGRARGAYAAAAVEDRLAVGQLLDLYAPELELSDGDQLCAGDVPLLVFLRLAHVDELILALVVFRHVPTKLLGSDVGDGSRLCEQLHVPSWLRRRAQAAASVRRALVVARLTGPMHVRSPRPAPGHWSRSGSAAGHASAGSKPPSTESIC